MQRQVALLASSVDTSITAWDFRTGTQLTQYKTNASPRNGLCCVGRDYLVAAQTSKDALQFWTWHKDQALQRSFTQERMTAVAASPCGTYIAGGGASGSLYVWEVASGRLLRSWAAHYKGVSCLAFSESGLMLFSGAEDTMTCVWLLADLLDVSQDPSDPSYHRPQALYAWSEHTLPVTGICIGQGEACALVVTCSLDRTVKVHRLSDGKLLKTASLPSALNCVAMDAGEHAVYAGGSDGVVYEVALAGAEPAPGLGALSSPAGAPSASAPFHRMEGHSRAVNSLALAQDGESMLSGSEDGTACVWDLRSRQAVQVLQGPGKHPITSVLVLMQPEHMVAGPAGGDAGQGGRQGPKRPQPLAPLVKFPGMAGALKPWEGAAVVIDGSQAYEGIAQQSGLWGASSALPPPGLWDLPCSLSSHAGAAAPDAMDTEPSEPAAGGSTKLEKEVARLKEELKQAKATSQKWQQMHSQLHAETVKLLK